MECHSQCSQLHDLLAGLWVLWRPLQPHPPYLHRCHLLVYLHCRRLLRHGVIARLVLNCSRRQNFYELLAARALVGIGEASYVTMAPSIIADMYPEVSGYQCLAALTPLQQTRTMMLSVFYLAIPLGRLSQYVPTTTILSSTALSASLWAARSPASSAAGDGRCASRLRWALSWPCCASSL
jgi:MFS family permease